MNEFSIKFYEEILKGNNIYDAFNISKGFMYTKLINLLNLKDNS